MNPFVVKQLQSINTILARWMEKRAREYPVPDGIEIIRNIPYIQDDNPCHKMDIFRPAGAPRPLPVVVNLHGGGLVLCTKEVNTQFCCELAKRGFLVFSVDYPLVPEADIPQMLRDVSAGMDQVHSRLYDYGGDPNRVFLVGDSAGAFLSVYATAAKNCPAVASSLNLTPTRLPVHAWGLISGMFYTTSNDNVGLFLKKDFYGKNWRTHPFMAYVHPDRPEIAGNLPPCILITSKSYNLRNYTMKFYRGLQACGNRCDLIDHPRSAGLQHDFLIVSPEHPASQETLDRMTEFLLHNHSY